MREDKEAALVKAASSLRGACESRHYTEETNRRTTHLKDNSAAANAQPAGVVLRSYQALDIVRMRHAYRDGASRLLYQLPTGGGKTIVFAFVVASAVQRGRRVLILGHRQEIVEQISAALAAMSVAHGIIAPGHPMRPSTSTG